MVAYDVICICQFIDDVGVLVDDGDFIALAGELVHQRDADLAAAHDHDVQGLGFHIVFLTEHDSSVPFSGRE